MRMTALAGAGLLLLGLAACGNESAAGGALAGKTYLSTSITQEGDGPPPSPDTKVRMQFTDDGRLVADAGCNSMQATVSTDDGKLTLTEPLAMTTMGCPGDRGKLDSWLSNLLQSKPTWKLAGEKLTVVAGGTTIAFSDREIVEPDAAIDGTKWTLSGVIDYDTVGHQAGAEKAWITFNGDRVTGFTGCNELNGKVARAGNTITFGELATTRKACAEAEAGMEKALIAGLKGEMTYKIDAKNLTLSTADAGLTFIAA